MPPSYRVEQDKTITQRSGNHANLNSKGIQLKRFCTTLFNLEKNEFVKRYKFKSFIIFCKFLGTQF